MDRTAWIAVVFCAIGLVLWEVYVVKTAQPRPKQGPMVAAQASASPGAAASAPPASSLTPGPAATAEPTATPAATATPAVPEQTESLRNNDVEIRLTNRGGGIAQATLLNHAAENGARVTLNSGDHLPIGAIVENPAEPNLGRFNIVRVGDAVQFEQADPAGLAMRKKFFFPRPNEKKDNFIVEMDVDLTNNKSQAFSNQGYFVALGAAQPIHRNDYSTYTRVVWCVNGSAKGTDVNWFSESNGFLGTGVGGRPARPIFHEALKPAEWVAVSNQFFTTLIAPLTSKAEAVWARRYEVDAATKVYGIEGAMGMPAVQLQPGQTYSAKFEIYAGPKLYHRLATLEHNEAEVMEFGVFKIICQALLNALNTLHSVLGNYAAAILALTCIVKAILWPIQNRANRSARQMAALSPKMQELREKYKDDPTKMNQELMKLYKEYGINPVGGCLPMVIQIPIFFGLFTMLRQAVELRNASFLWIKDLSQPDTVAHLPGLGWPVNILPLIMAATSFWMTHLTPKSGDPTQQRMMMFTPLIFIVFCYNFAAALALYYTTQNLLTILQLYQNRRQPAPKLERMTKPKR